MSVVPEALTFVLLSQGVYFLKGIVWAWLPLKASQLWLSELIAVWFQAETKNYVTDSLARLLMVLL